MAPPERRTSRGQGPGPGLPAVPPGGPWAGPPILAPPHAAPLLAARGAGRLDVETSLDLGLSRVLVVVAPEGAVLPCGAVVPWAAVERVAVAVTGGGGGRCFAVHAPSPGAVAELEEVQVFSPETNRRYSLLATAGAPTMLVSGVQMHRTAGQDPWGDSVAKVRCVAPVVGPVLDTCTGLGYTAIVAAGAGGAVVTVELDPAATAVARLNPWSQGLFGALPIERLVGDSATVVQRFPDAAFARIVHDPPAFSLAGDLYSGAFYRQLRRVLSRGGRLFHYAGNVASGSGQRVTRGVVQRLKEAGFGRVVPRPEAFGVLAFSEGRG